MADPVEPVPAPDAARLIHTTRDQRVILESDWARIWAAETHALNQAVGRNR